MTQPDKVTYIAVCGADIVANSGALDEVLRAAEGFSRVHVGKSVTVYQKLNTVVSAVSTTWVKNLETEGCL